MSVYLQQISTFITLIYIFYYNLISYIKHHSLPHPHPQSVDANVQQHIYTYYSLITSRSTRHRGAVDTFAQETGPSFNFLAQHAAAHAADAVVIGGLD